MTTRQMDDLDNARMDAGIDLYERVAGAASRIGKLL